jgi:hypothetical protein
VETLTGVEIRRVTDAGPPMDVADTPVELIGNTPMLRLDRTARDLECTLVAKLELFNPGGSSKGRIALAVIRGAEPLGRDRRGYNCIFVCPDKSNAKVGTLSQRRRDELRRVVRPNRFDRGAVGQG